MADSNGKRPRPTAWLDLGAAELRLLVATLLAGTYLAVWPLLRATSGAAPALAAGSTDTAQPSPGPGPTWIDQLPVAERPVVVVPEGWTLASSERPAPTAQARVVRVARRRVRTRSS